MASVDTPERRAERERCAQHAEVCAQHAEVQLLELGKPMDWQHADNPDYAKGWYECALTIADIIRTRTRRLAIGTEKLESED